jgi:hypothetical protein
MFISVTATQDGQEVGELRGQPMSQLTPSETSWKHITHQADVTDVVRFTASKGLDRRWSTSNGCKREQELVITIRYAKPKSNVKTDNNLLPFQILGHMKDVKFLLIYTTHQPAQTLA